MIVGSVYIDAQVHVGMRTIIVIISLLLLMKTAKKTLHSYSNRFIVNGMIAQMTVLIDLTLVF